MIKRKIAADLHNHSTASDGTFSPAEMVVLAKKAGLRAFALTDHDSIAGLDEAVSQGQESGIMVIPGVEVSLRFQRSFFVGTLHLLLYFSEVLFSDPAFRKDLTAIIGKGRGIALVRDRIDAINKEFGPGGREPLLKRPLEIDEITSQGENITRRHFFLALSTIHKIDTRAHIDRMIGNKSPAYIPSGIEMQLLQPFFARYPVVKVLAHPAAGSFPGSSHYKEVLPTIDVIERLLPQFLDPDILGIDGLEIYYPAHTKKLERVLLNWATRHNLLITGGSDCHDSTIRPLGVAGVTQEELDTLLARIGH